jgi:hypothetical protein
MPSLNATQTAFARIHAKIARLENPRLRALLHSAAKYLANRPSRISILAWTADISYNIHY